MKEAMLALAALLALGLAWSARDASALPPRDDAAAAQESPEAVCLQCHGGRRASPPGGGGERAPRLDPSFSMDWLMFELASEQPPPFAVIPEPRQVSRGSTHYDWHDRKMTEIYRDRCIDIFPGGNDFSCQFLSDRGETYFIQFELGDLTRPTSCCRWSEADFWAPRPDVLRSMRFQQDLEINGEDVRFWIADLPWPGPFGYGTAAGSDRPVAFWFRVIGGWVQQNFSNYSAARPPPEVFALPPICEGQLEVCSLR